MVAGARVRAPMMLIHTVAAGGGSILFLRRRPLPRRARLGRRQSGACLLPPRRAPHRHRCQCHGGQAEARVLPEDFRPRPGSAARCGDRAAALRRAVRGDRRWALGRRGRRRLHPHRRREHGERDPDHLGAARLRRRRLCAQYLRRRRRAACLPRRRRARHGARAHPPPLGRALGLRHGPRGVEGDPNAGRARPFSTRTDSPPPKRSRHRWSNRQPRNSKAKALRGIASACRCELHLRYLGTDSSLPVPLGTLADLKESFEAMHRQRFGFTSPGKPIEIEAVEVEALGGGEHPQEPDLPLAGGTRSPKRKAASSAAAPGTKRRCSCGRLSSPASASTGRR